MAVHHVEVALVDRQVHRLADRAARVVQRSRHVGELDEVAEILDARVAPAFIEVADERRAVGRREHRVLAADQHVAGGIARLLNELARRRRLDQLPAHAARHAHPLALNVRARRLPDRQGLRVFAELDADLLEDRVGIALDQGQALFAEDLVVRNLARDVGNRHRGAGGTRRALGIAAARAAAGGRLCFLLVRAHPSSMVTRAAAADPFAALACPCAPSKPPAAAQLTGGAPPSAVRRATKSSIASTIAGSRTGGTYRARASCHRV